jgi:hypothetical protein
VTPQQHKQHLLALADELETTARPGGLGQRAAEAIRDFAARLTPGVSDAMVEIASKAACKADDEDGLRWPDQIIRKALEAVFPLVDDGQAKDAARYRWLLDWYLRAGKRAEIDPLGHIRVTTSEIVSAAIDAAMKEQRG